MAIQFQVSPARRSIELFHSFRFKDRKGCFYSNTRRNENLFSEKL
jgi:hypothetical protein